jgi:hypothetical protein
MDKEITFHFGQGKMVSNKCTFENKYYSIIHADEENNLHEIIVTKPELIKLYLELGKALLEEE